jgi:hypothetical protein
LNLSFGPNISCEPFVIHRFAIIAFALGAIMSLNFAGKACAQMSRAEELIPSNESSDWTVQAFQPYWMSGNYWGGYGGVSYGGLPYGGLPYRGLPYGGGAYGGYPRNSVSVPGINLQAYPGPAPSSPLAGNYWPYYRVSPYGFPYRWPYSAFPSTIVVASTAPQSRAVPSSSGHGLVVIANRTENNRLVEYSLNGVKIRVKPGQSQKVLGDRPWVIEFRRGKDRETARYAVKPGIYEFQQIDYGWELFDATIAPPTQEPETSLRLPRPTDPSEPAPTVP